MLKPGLFGFDSMKKFALLAIVAACFWGIRSVQADTLSMGDPGFETTTNPILDGGDSVSAVWNSFGDQSSPFSVSTDVAHTGTHSITNNISFSSVPSGFTLLYQPVLADNSSINGQTFNYSFWLYYDATLAGNNQATDTIGYDFSARSLLNQDTADIGGTIAASSLTSKTWTQFTGTMPVDDSISGFTSEKIEAVLSAPSGKWYADDVNLTNAVPEPSSILLLVVGAAGFALAKRRTSKV
ncbi:MAG TPA: PEP-CTERM sorting domain-containing protein [Pirellulales bacterium]|jgi:hypothetical protein